MEAHQTSDESPEQLDALDVPAAEGVTLRNLSFAYGDTLIFSGLSLTAHPGDIIGVTGPGGLRQIHLWPGLPLRGPL